MSYQTYKTEAFILKGQALGEGNRLLFVLTKELGYLPVFARSARLNTSKLRYALQDLSYASLALVRGREYWRVVGAENSEHLWRSLGGDKEKLRLFSQLATLIARLFHGEEKNEKLFAIFMEAASFLKTENFSSDENALLEAVLVARVLSALGYFPERNFYQKLLKNPLISKDFLKLILPVRRNLYRDINASLKATHL